MGAIFSCFSAHGDARRESLSKDGKSAPQNRPCFSAEDLQPRPEDHKAYGDTAACGGDEWRLVDLEEDDVTQKHRGATYRGHGDQAGSEVATKMFHHNAEDWRHFRTILDQEYRDQIQPPIYRPPTVDLRQEQPGDLLRASSSAPSYTDDKAAEQQDTVDYIRELVKRLVNRAETEAALKQITEESGSSDEEWEGKSRTPPTKRNIAWTVDVTPPDTGRLTTPTVDGQRNHDQGILTKTPPGDSDGDTVKRNIAWTVDVTPPDTGRAMLDLDISDAYQRACSKILAQREQEKNQIAELAGPSCRPINRPACGLISHGCRIPVPVRGAPARLFEPTPRGGRIPPDIAKQHVYPTSQLGLKDNLDLDPITKREVDFFKRSQLFRERVRMNEFWQTGLTPLQIWIVKNHIGDTREELPQPSPPKKKSRTPAITCKISTWRK